MGEGGNPVTSDFDILPGSQSCRSEWNKNSSLFAMKYSRLVVDDYFRFHEKQRNKVQGSRSKPEILGSCVFTFILELFIQVSSVSFVEDPWCDGKWTEPLISSKRSIAVTDKAKNERNEVSRPSIVNDKWLKNIRMKVSRSPADCKKR